MEGKILNEWSLIFFFPAITRVKEIAFSFKILYNTISPAQAIENKV